MAPAIANLDASWQPIFAARWNPVLHDVRFSNSANDRLAQLADMCAGAIARSYKSDRDQATRWRRMLGRKIENVWEFS
jgi:Protein of unknown function (DUF3800)